MPEELIINKTLNDAEIYKDLIPQIESLLVTDEPVLSGLSNLTAVLKESFDKVSWVGFYFVHENKLYLGPFQGKIACTNISMGAGVCGTAAIEKRTIVVKNVDEFPGHIACDPGSKSEIVVPIIINNNVVGVLDLDSYEFNSFDEVDKHYLEQLVALLIKKYDLNNFKIA